MVVSSGEMFKNNKGMFEELSCIIGITISLA